MAGGFDLCSGIARWLLLTHRFSSRTDPTYYLYSTLDNHFIYCLLLLVNTEFGGNSMPMEAFDECSRRSDGGDLEETFPLPELLKHSSDAPSY